MCSNNSWQLVTQSYFPNYYSLEDILVTQEKVECVVNMRVPKMGFLDPGSETEDLMPGTVLQLPLWYIKELKMNNPYFTVQMPTIYRSVHKAVCEAETTHIELGKLNTYFYEYGRYLTPYDSSHIVGQIVFETLRQRVRHLLDISKGKDTANSNGGSMALIHSSNHDSSEHRLDDIESKLLNVGLRTNTLYTNWLQMKYNTLSISDWVKDHARKRKRNESNDTNGTSRELEELEQLLPRAKRRA